MAAIRIRDRDTMEAVVKSLKANEPEKSDAELRKQAESAFFDSLRAAVPNLGSEDYKAAIAGGGTFSEMRTYLEELSGAYDLDAADQPSGQSDPTYTTPSPFDE